MTRQKTVFVCNECGSEAPRWTGKCMSCGAWNTMVEMIVDKHASKGGSHHMAGQTSKPVPLNKVVMSNEVRFSSGIRELNRVLGGGIVPGEMVLVGGDPGIGKSTLMLQVALSLTRNGLNVLYLTGEESLRQVKMRAERLGSENEGLLLMAETDVDLIISNMVQLKSQVVIIDSIQTLVAADLTASPGSVSQVRECTSRLLRIAKANDIAVFLVGHVTKEGSIAGPRVLEHMVDCVLYFEGDNKHAFRILRSVKNRFGATHEIGVFSMEEDGLQEVANPSAFLIQERSRSVIGSVVTATIEGTRPMLVEVQALLTETSYGNPRRMTTGVDYNRTTMLMAVLQKRAGLLLAQQDAYVNAIGGIKINEPAADLAICVAVYASFKNIAIAPNMMIVGEVGLTGEVRGVSQLEVRIREAEKMGFASCIIPEVSLRNSKAKFNIETIGVKNLRDALAKI